MTRGDLVTVVAPGEFGKPRPALVVQSDRFRETATVTVLLMTSTEAEMPLFRVADAMRAVNRALALFLGIVT